MDIKPRPAAIYRDIYHNSICSLPQLRHDYPLNENILNTDHRHHALLALLHRHQTSGFYVSDRFPPDKLRNAIAYFPIPRQGKILGLVDGTIFGSCKVGLAITTNGLIWKNDWTTDSNRTSLTWNELIACEQTIRAEDSCVAFSSGVNFDMSGSSMKPAELIQLCFALIDFFAQKETQHDAPQRTLADEIIDPQLIGKGMLVSLFAKFVKSDGAVTQKEIALLEDLFDELSANDAAEKRILISVFNKAKDTPTSFEEITQAIAEYPASDDDEFNELIYHLLWEVALVDGPLSAIKQDLLKILPRLLGLHSLAYAEAAAKYLPQGRSNSTTGDDAHGSFAERQASYFAVLGCTPHTSDAELKMAYRRKISSLHPDKLQSKDLADELLQFANQQVQKINHAYAEIMKYRNN